MAFEYKWRLQGLIITQGLPGSGKSTWARKMVQDHPETVEGHPPVIRVNRDDVRRELGFKFDPKREKDVTLIQDSRIDGFLKNGYTVIADDTYLNEGHIAFREGQARRHGVDFAINSDFMDVSVEDCIKRDISEERQKAGAAVGKDVIEQLYYRYWSHQERPRNHGDQEAIMCDLDGTLCLLPKGMGYPAAYQRDYRDDLPNPAVRAMLHAANLSGITVLLLSGRFSERRDQTLDWLTKYQVKYDELIMRPLGDRRQDYIVKKELYVNQVQGNYKILWVMDDRPSVCRMWRAECDLPVFQVAPNIEF